MKIINFLSLLDYYNRRGKLDKLVTKFNIELRKEDSSRAELATTYREIKALIRK